MPYKPISPEDLYLIRLITDCRISPDGKQIVYVQEHVDRAREKRYANLWLMPSSPGRPRPFTSGDQKDTQPRWSPDGTAIAFVSNRENEDRTALYTIATDGGEARKVARSEGEIGSFDWSPDSRSLVCARRLRDEEEWLLEQDPKRKELGRVARHIDRTFFKADGHGFLPRERWHLWAYNLRTRRVDRLTAGEVFDELDPRWSPDGRWIAFCSNRAPDPDLDPDAVGIYLLKPGAGPRDKPVEVATPYGPKGNLAWSPDGRWLAYVGSEGNGSWSKNASLWVVPIDGSQPARNLTAAYDLHVDSTTSNDLPGGLPMSPPIWSLEGSHLIFQASRHGSTLLLAIAVDGSEAPLTLIDGPGAVGAVSQSGDMGIKYGLPGVMSSLACLRGSMSTLAQVHTADGCVAERDPNVRQQSRVSEPLLRSRSLGEAEEIWFKGPGGDDLQGWILKPFGFDPARQYPAILEIHGGPRAMYGHLFMHEFQVLAGRGYVVFYTNPRGSQGYGEAHSQAIVNDWGNADYADLMAWTDLVAGKPYVDAERLGVTGGSYGGYMTLWMIGHTQRFKAAVAQRVVSNWISMWGSSDMNWSFQDEFGDKPPWENVENLWRQSPMAYMGNARTPTLIIHSEEDHRCPIEQGEQAYVALRTQGVPSEMVRFPGESHGLSRGGRTDRRVARLEHILRWFDRWL